MPTDHKQKLQKAFPRAAIEAPLRAVCDELRRGGGDPREIADALRYLSVEVRQEHL